MHDINRDEIFKKTSSGGKSKEHNHSHDDSHTHSSHTHNHHSHNHHHHNDELTGHDHQHEDFEGHYHFDHSHDEHFESRAYNHVHEHSHQIRHAHYHKHDPQEDSMIHRIFNNPLRDWFTLIFMSILLVVHQTVSMKTELADGLLVVVVVIGLFPLLKNAIFDGLLRKRILPELVVAIFLIGLLFYGELLTASIITIFICLGSFLNLNFSWK